MNSNPPHPMNGPRNYKTKRITAEDVLLWIFGGIVLAFGLACGEGSIIGVGALVLLVNTCHVLSR